ncbi:retrovirus-related pol polyprotein from transposon TNT 1-94 [Tanacetum coccineum]
MIMIHLWLHPQVIQLLNMSTVWDTPGIIHRSNIDYAERIWEEFVQSIQTFLTNKKNLSTASRGSPLYYSYEDHVLGILKSVGKDGREIFGMAIPDALLTNATKRAPYYSEYLEHVAKYQQYLDEERGKAEEEAVTESPKATKVTKPKATKQTKPSAPKATKVTKPADDKAPNPISSQPSKPKPSPTKPLKAVPKKKQRLVNETPDEPLLEKRSKGGLVGKRRMPKSPLKLVDEFIDEGVPHKEPAYDDEEANLRWALELSLKDQRERT